MTVAIFGCLTAHLIKSKNHNFLMIGFWLDMVDW